MSTFKNPVGPQSPQVYWRRRLIVGLGALAVIIVVLLIVFGRGTGTAPDDITNPAGDSTTSPTKEPVLEEGADCDPATIAVTPVTDKTQYAAGEQPMISMSIMNNGAVACVLNVGTTQQVLEITSGDESYWISTDCQSEAIDVDLLLEPGVAQSTTPIPWDRTRSDPSTCTSDRPAVTAGGASYHLTVSMGEITSEDTAQFLLN